jgi:GT2 family glycosyltransferase
MTDPASAAPTISVVTVTFNSIEFVPRCIESVARNAGAFEIEHIVVDNASRDGTPDRITERFPSVRLLRNELNRGLTAANNQGEALARGRYVVFLNPDTVVPDGTFETLVRIMDGATDIGILAPRLVDGDGRFWVGIMGHRAPNAWTLINAYLLLNRLSHDWFPGVLRSKDIQGLEDCDWACGACIMVRREVADAFAWRQFGSGDDFDYCIQIREAGWRVCLTGDAEVIHFGGRSLKLAKSTLWAGTASNFAHYLRAHHGPVHTFIGIAGMRLGLRLRGFAHFLLYLLTRDPERLYKVNQTRRFLAHDDYSVLRGAAPTAPTSYPK